MEPAKLTAMASALAIIISDNLTDDDDLVSFAIAIDLLSDNLDAIIAQRAVEKKKIPSVIINP